MHGWGEDIIIKSVKFYFLNLHLTTFLQSFYKWTICLQRDTILRSFAVNEKNIVPLSDLGWIYVTINPIENSSVSIYRVNLGYWDRHNEYY